MRLWHGMGGHPLPEAVQEAKLHVVAEIAYRVGVSSCATNALTEVVR